jgi:hypothetical protein
MAIGLSNARLAIPKVNQNPKPPRLGTAKPVSRLVGIKGSPQVPQVNQAGGSNRATSLNPLTKAIAAKSAATAPASPTNVATSTGSTSAVAAAPASTAAPSAERFAIPTWTPSTTGEPDPRDSTYWANLAKLKFTDEQAYAKSLGEESASDSSYNLALQQAVRGRGVQERELGENAIKGNLSASGWLGRNQAEQSTDYAEERGAAARGHEGEQQAFAAARDALQQGFGIEAAQELAEAAGRRAEGGAEETEKGAPEASPVAAALGPRVNAGHGAVAKSGISANAGNPYKKYLKRQAQEGKK